MTPKEHIAGPGRNYIDIPAVRTHRNGKHIDGGSNVLLTISSHPESDQLVILTTENNDQYIIRTGVFQAACSNSARTGRTENVIDFKV